MTSLGQNAATKLAQAGRTVTDKVRSVLGSGRDGDGASATRSGWLVLTVFRPREEVADAEVQGALGELGRPVEVRLTTAPNGMGTEVAARFLPADGSDDGSDGSGTVGPDALRAALRRVKQILEVGEVLTLEPLPHGKRNSTPGGELLDAARGRADREGVL